MTLRTLALMLVALATPVAAQPTDPYADPPPVKKDPDPPKKDSGPPPPKDLGTIGGPTKSDPTPAKKDVPLPPPAKKDVAPPPAKKDITPPPPSPPIVVGKDQPRTPGIPSRVGVTDVAAVQGLLSVQRLDGWLLFDRDGENPIAVRVVAPAGHPTRPWYYLIPAQGDPIALMHSSEQRSFDHLPGKKLTYANYRDLDKQLKVVLAKVKSVAVEYSPKGTIPGISRVDAGTLEGIRAAGVTVRSSETLVQYTKAIWGDAGRTAHYVAVHHIIELRKEALAYVAKQLQSGAAVSEYDVQQRLAHGMTMRGLVGAPPVVAAGINTADPYYVPTADKTAAIKRGDLLVISLAGKVDKPDGIYAAQTWVAVADRMVQGEVQRAWETIVQARDAAVALITDRAKKNRPITGAEIDDSVRAIDKKAGLADRVMHRTGHSIDTDLQGGGADLDNFEVKDSRILTPGTGFTIGPGLYFQGLYGVRTEVSVYLAPAGPEVTTPGQDTIETLLK